MTLHSTVMQKVTECSVSLKWAFRNKHGPLITTEKVVWAIISKVCRSLAWRYLTINVLVLSSLRHLFATLWRRCATLLRRCELPGRPTVFSVAIISFLHYTCIYELPAPVPSACALLHNETRFCSQGISCLWFCSNRSVVTS